MGFFENNKNFIIQKLKAEMKSLTFEEKIQYYEETLKTETIYRLKVSYNSETDKVLFYKSAFEHIGIYEADYLLLNVFYEKESDIILNSIFTLDNSLFHFKSTENSLLIVNMLRSLIFNKTDNVLGFAKKQFGELIGLRDSDWCTIEKYQNPIMNKYGTWINSQNKKEILIDSLLLFSKIWDLVWGNPFKGEKACVLLNHIISSESYVNFQAFDRSTDILNSLLFPVENPFKISIQEANTIPGYEIKRREFDHKLDVSRQMAINYSDLSFEEIFIQFKNSSSEVREAIKENLIKKINSGFLPSSFEIDNIENLISNHGDELIPIKELLYQKCYLYEKMF